MIKVNGKVFYSEEDMIAVLKALKLASDMSCIQDEVIRNSTNILTKLTKTFEDLKNKIDKKL
jgi:hypothetical protein